MVLASLLPGSAQAPHSGVASAHAAAAVAPVQLPTRLALAPVVREFDVDSLLGWCLNPAVVESPAVAPPSLLLKERDVIVEVFVDAFVILVGCAGAAGRFC